MHDRSFFGIFGGERPDPQEGAKRELYGVARELYYHWHTLEGKKRDVIDFDLTKRPRYVSAGFDFYQSKPTRGERTAVVDALESLVTRIREVPERDNRPEHNWEFFEEQIAASHIFARKLRGDEIDNYQYIRETTGVLECVPQPQIDALKTKVLLNLGRLDYAIADERAFLALRNDHQIPPDEAHKTFEETGDDAVTKLKSFTGDRSITVDCKIVRVNEPKQYWWVWADTDPESQLPTLKQNFGENKIWTPGKCIELGYHEYAQHMARMAKRKQLIDADKLPEIFGLTNVHGRESVVEEGLAQTLTYFIPNALDGLSVYQGIPAEKVAEMKTEAQLQIDYSILRQMVYATAHLMVNSPKGYDKEIVVEYIKTNAPFESDAEIERQIKLRTESPLHQTYLYSYGIGAARHMRYAAALNTDGKREYLRNIFERPYSLAQADRLVEGLVANPKYRSSSYNLQDIEHNDDLPPQAAFG